MLFKVDENLPVEIAGLLSDLGHDAKTIKDQRLQGVNDRVLLERCDHEKRTLVTLDIDFSDQDLPTAGSRGDYRPKSW